MTTISNTTNITDETKVSSTMSFTRSDIQALGDAIRITDSDKDLGLDLFCYENYKNNEIPSNDSLLLQCRGVVFNDEKIVMKAFPYTIVYNNIELEEIEKNIQPIFKDCEFYDAHEGFLIRMFNFSGKWFTCTHRKLDAFNSKWASRESFGTVFKKGLEAEVENNPSLKKALPTSDKSLLERFQETLDITKQYMFLVRNTESNRIVCMTPDRPTVYHVGTFVDEKLVMTEDINIPYPKKHSFVNIDELCAYAKNVDCTQMQGIIVFAPNNVQFKVMNLDYQDYFNVRGNEPSIKFRYLQVRMKKKILDMLYSLYPEMTDSFNNYENTLFEIARNIHKAYIERFIKKTYVTVPKEEFAVIKKCHMWHLTDRKENRISLDKVIEVLNEQSPSNLNHMIRNLISKKKAENSPEKPKLNPSVNDSHVPVLDLSPPAVVQSKKRLLLSTRSDTTTNEPTEMNKLSISIDNPTPSTTSSSTWAKLASTSKIEKPE